MRRDRESDLALAAVAAVLGLIGCLLIQGSCFGIPTEQRGRPYPDTPRGAYCGPLDHWYRWILFPIGAIVAAGIVSRLLSRSKHARVWALLAVAVIVGVNTVIVSGLQYFDDF